MEWMSRIYLKDPRAYQESAPGYPTGFFEDYLYDANTSTEDMKAIGWFSSLWTLQEICLRPDMWLCNRNWELFTVHGNVPIAFNTIVALAAECRKDLNIDAASEGRHQLDMSTSFLNRDERLQSLIAQDLYPRGFVELLELFDRTGMQHLHVIRRDYILLLGSQRHCERHRAEAIMSVLDTKRWRLLSNPGPLVLGLYPLEFVREVAKSIGPSFYNSLSFRAINLETLVSHEMFPQGSLMPFESRKGQYIESKHVLNKEFGEEQYNSSAQTWSIENDGSVCINEASILASTNSNDAGEIIGSIWLTYIEPEDHSDPRFDIGWPEGRRMRSCDIQQWCKTYHPSTVNFVVETGRVFGASRGLLLKETSPGSKVLYKVGNYLTSLHKHYGRQVMAKVTAVEQVAWTVL
jgi:hypothetical protein